MDATQLSSTLPRLVPAVVSGQQIYVPCPEWCSINHIADPAGALSDVWHEGDFIDLHVPRIGRNPELLAFARLSLDPAATDARREAYITVGDGGEGFDLTPKQALQFASNLEAFAEQIRALARTARDAA